MRGVNGVTQSKIRCRKHPITVVNARFAESQGRTPINPGEPGHHRMNLLVSRMDEQQRRWYVALESMRVGHDPDTIRQGRRELESLYRWVIHYFTSRFSEVRTNAITASFIGCASEFQFSTIADKSESGTKPGCAGGCAPCKLFIFPPIAKP